MPFSAAGAPSLALFWMRFVVAPGGIQHKWYEKERRSKARAASRRAARARSPSLELTGSSSELFVLGSEGLISVLQPESAPSVQTICSTIMDQPPKKKPKPTVFK